MADEEHSSTSSSSEYESGDDAAEAVVPVSPADVVNNYHTSHGLLSMKSEQTADEHSVTKQNNKTKTLASLLHVEKTFKKYLNVFPGMKAGELKDKLEEVSLSNHDESESRLTPGFEKQLILPPLHQSRKQRRREGLKERDKTKGAKWFNMPATEITDEIKNDLAVLQMRGSLDPKHFYKRGNEKILPKYFQIGTVVESPAEFYSARVPKKQRKQTLVDELLDDAEYRKYQKKKYAEAVKSQQQKRVHASQKRKVKQKWNSNEARKTKKTKN